MRTGAARYFDGRTSARHDVTLELAPQALVIRDGAGAIVDQWAYIRLKHLSSPDHIFRIGLRKNPLLARLEITDMELAHDIDVLAPDIDRTGASARRDSRRVIGWASAKSNASTREQTRDLQRSARVVRVLLSGGSDHGTLPSGVPRELAQLVTRAGEDEDLCRQQGASGLDALLRAVARAAFGPPAFVPLSV